MVQVHLGQLAGSEVIIRILLIKLWQTANFENLMFIQRDKKLFIYMVRCIDFEMINNTYVYKILSHVGTTCKMT